MRGLAEAASELRRHLLDRLREGEVAPGEALLASMDDVYSALVVIDCPDALTNGLRRTLDALRAVLERTAATSRRPCCRPGSSGPSTARPG